MPRKPSIPTSNSLYGFAALSNTLAKNPKVTNPDALAAAIGRKKLGEAEMTKRSVAGRKK